MIDRRKAKSLLISNIYFPPDVGGISHFMGAVASTLGQDRVCCLTSVAGERHLASDQNSPRVYRRPAIFSHSWTVQGAALCTSMVELILRERPHIIQLATTGEGYLGLF